MSAFVLALVMSLSLFGCKVSPEGGGGSDMPMNTTQDATRGQDQDQDQDSDQDQDQDQGQGPGPQGPGQGGGDCASKFDTSVTDPWDPKYCPDGLTVSTCPLGSSDCTCECPSATQERKKKVNDLVWNEICGRDEDDPAGDLRGKRCRSHFGSNRTRTVCTVPNDDYLQGIVGAFQGKPDALVDLAKGVITAIRQQYTLGNSATYLFGFRIYCGTNPITDPNGSQATWGDGDIALGDCLTNSSCDKPLLDP